MTARIPCIDDVPADALNSESGLASVPQPDRIFGGQWYFKVRDDFAQQMYRKTDGSLAPLTWWATRCASCGASFTFSLPSEARAMTRRCKAHRNPGHRV